MATQSLFTAAPSGITVRTDAYSVGTEFYVTQGCWLTHLRWYRPDTTSPGTVTGRVFSIDTTAGTTGVAVTPVTTITPAAAAGWNNQALATPVRLSVGARYRVATYAGRYAQLDPYFANAGPAANGITSGFLVAPNVANSWGQKQGSYGGTSTVDFPSQGFASGTCWFSDVVVTDVDPTGLSQRMFAGPLH